MGQIKIGLIGKARSGKDTVADYLVSQYQFHEFKFSKGIHDVIQLVRGKDTQKAKQRRELQDVGQGIRRSLGEDSWVEYTMRDIQLQNKQDENLVISDVRQTNEGRYLAEHGYILIRVDTDEDVRIQRMVDNGDVFNLEDLNHETEQIDMDYHRLITNNGTLEELYQQIDGILRELQQSGSDNYE